MTNKKNPEKNLLDMLDHYVDVKREESLEGQPPSLIAEHLVLQFNLQTQKI